MRLYVRLIEQWRYRLLLSILLAAIFLQPLLHDMQFGPAILIGAYGTILIGGVYATHPPRWLLAWCSVLTIALVGLSWFFLYTAPSKMAVSLIVVTAILGVFTTSRTLTELVSAPAANADAMAGAIFGYFLLVVIWALFFRALEVLSPGAFGLVAEGDVFTELLYFSLVTITTLGYGDISPVDPLARISAGLEAAMGTLYIAILIARIVGAVGHHRA